LHEGVQLLRDPDITESSASGWLSGDALCPEKLL
jgi:hypothetical protein